MIKITNIDLYTQKYNIETLEQNINNLSLQTLLNTQHLTIEFCVKYLLDDDNTYAWREEENDISYYDIVSCQPHINIDELVNMYNDFNSKPLKN